MRVLPTVLLTLVCLAAPVGGRADVVEQLLSTPATQMDLGVARMGALLVPVFADLGVFGTVLWNREDSRIEIRIVTDLPAEGTASWEPARRAASAVRARLGVDPLWGKLQGGDSVPLMELFELSTAAAPPADALADLIRIRVAVHWSALVPPTFYEAALLDDDVFLTTSTFDGRRR